MFCQLNRSELVNKSHTCKTKDNCINLSEFQRNYFGLNKAYGNEKDNIQSQLGNSYFY